MLIAALASVLITSCYDGDTCRSNTGVCIRLACIHTPEPRGKSANSLKEQPLHRDHSSAARSVRHGTSPGKSASPMSRLSWKPLVFQILTSIRKKGTNVPLKQLIEKDSIVHNRRIRHFSNANEFSSKMSIIDYLRVSVVSYKLDIFPVLIIIV